ncbi:neurogenic locus notch homolog protein 1-like, partial [Mizuhopecten yessoensis]|uniref:neurogenic locus notch homolog protein 1-like n=1 Tax=Mizuhopecten yessoensis TaxID=6573 RepID=UPI000B45C0B5
SGLARRNCGKSLQSETWNNVSSVDVVFISDSGSQFPGFLMCFSLQRVDPCTVGEPCNGGTCTPDADLTDFSCTNCPQGLTGKRCNEDPCEGNLCKDGKTCKPCPDCNSTTKNKQWKKCCKQTCKGKGKSGGNRRCVKKCKERKMYYCS